MTNSVDPDQTAHEEQSDLGPTCLLLYLNLSADVIFQMHFFLAL